MWKIDIIDIDYFCEHNVEFPKTLYVSSLDEEDIMIRLEEEAKIDYNDASTVEVYGVEFEVDYDK